MRPSLTQGGGPALEPIPEEGRGEGWRADEEEEGGSGQVGRRDTRENRRREAPQPVPPSLDDETAMYRVLLALEAGTSERTNPPRASPPLPLTKGREKETYAGVVKSRRPKLGDTGEGRRRVGKNQHAEGPGQGDACAGGRLRGPGSNGADKREGVEREDEEEKLVETEVVNDAVKSYAGNRKRKTMGVREKLGSGHKMIYQDRSRVVGDGIAVIFGTEMVTKNVVRQRVETVLGDSCKWEMATVIDRRGARDAWYHHVKIQGSLDEFEDAMMRMREVSPITGWSVHPWKSYNARMRSRMRICASMMDQGSDSESEFRRRYLAAARKEWREDRDNQVELTPFGGHITFLQLNINGQANFKSTEFKELIDANRPAVVALQEVYGGGTMKANVNKLGLKYAGYNVYNSTFDNEVAGSHGVLLMVKKTVKSWMYTDPSHTMVAVAAASIQGTALWISLYMPTKRHREERARARREVEGVVRSFRTDFPGHQIFMLTDGNCTPAEFDKWVGKTDLLRDATPEEKHTFATVDQKTGKAKKGTTIDFIASCNADVNSVEVLDGCQVSDHRPVLGVAEMEFIMPKKAVKQFKANVNAFRPPHPDCEKNRANFFGDKVWERMKALEAACSHFSDPAATEEERDDSDADVDSSPIASPAPKTPTVEPKTPARATSRSRPQTAQRMVGKGKREERQRRDTPPRTLKTSPRQRRGGLTTRARSRLTGTGSDILGRTGELNYEEKAEVGVQTFRIKSKSIKNKDNTLYQIVGRVPVVNMAKKGAPPTEGKKVFLEAVSGAKLGTREIRHRRLLEEAAEGCVSPLVQWGARTPEEPHDDLTPSPAYDVTRLENVKPPSPIKLGEAMPQSVQEAVDALSKGFVEAGKEACANAKLMKREGKREAKHLSDCRKRLMREKNAAFRKWRMANDLEQDDAKIEVCFRKWEVASAKLVEREREERRKEFEKFVSEGVEALSGGKPREGWGFIMKMCGRKKGGAAEGAMVDDSGKVQTEEVEILRVWAEHFGKLAADVSGKSRSQGQWQDVFKSRAAEGKTRELLPGLNRPLSFADLVEGCWLGKNNKAPGDSGFTLEFLRVCLPTRAEVREKREKKEEVAPENPMAQAMFTLASVMFATGTIPENFLGSTVVPIFKKGSQQDVGNYRGISLIEILMKVVTGVMARRMTTALEAADFFRREQGGFRRGEECIAQVIALYEICRRRRQCNMETWLFFADMMKAYDVVGHLAVLTKLKEAGVHGVMMEFFLGLYRNPRFRCKSKSGRSEWVDLMRGLRQGCGASPLLFLVFINDMMDAAERIGLGVDLPRAKKSDLQNGTVKRVIGLLFADDSVSLAGTREELRQTVVLMQAWATVFGMKFGLTKCAVMVVRPRGDGETLRKERAIQLCGEDIPWADKYEYLGLMFNDKLDIKIMLEERVKRLHGRTLPALTKLIGTACIPLAVKVLAIKSLLIPALTYGGELFGAFMSPSKRDRPVMVMELEKILDEALIMVSKGSWTPSSKILSSVKLLRREWKIPSVEAVWAGQMARATLKFRYSKGWVAELYRDPPANDKSWLKASKRYLKKMVGWYCGKADGFQGWTVDNMPEQTGVADTWASKAAATLGPVPVPVREALLDSFMLTGAPTSDGQHVAQNMSGLSLEDRGECCRLEGRRVQALVEDQRWRREGANPGKSIAKYQAAGFVGSREQFMSTTLLHPDLSRGFHWMARIRAGNFYCWKQAVELAGRVSEVQVASDTDSKGCGVCGDPAVADSVAHFLFDCPLPALKEFRERLGMLKHATMLCERVSDFKRVHDRCNGYKKGQVLTEQQCKLTKESMANMLLGGNMYRTDDMTSPSSPPFGFTNLEQWCCTNDKGHRPKTATSI
jgi:exonuclease III